MRCYLLTTALVLFLSALTVMSMESESLLSEADINMMLLDRENGPALSAPLDEEIYWESFNKWQCFSASSAKFSCDEIKYNRWKKVPLLTTENHNLTIEFAVSPEFDWNCERTQKEWAQLLKGRSNFCVYGAYLQNIDHLDGKTSEYWYINQIKAGNYYWIENDIHRKPVF